MPNNIEDDEKDNKFQACIFIFDTAVLHVFSNSLNKIQRRKDPQQNFSVQLCAPGSKIYRFNQLSCQYPKNWLN